jgi:cyclic lactone autoinducer peptide
MYSLTFLPFFYVIFWKNANPWWFLLAAFMANKVSSPASWNLIDQPKQQEKLIITEDGKE